MADNENELRRRAREERRARFEQSLNESPLSLLEERWRDRQPFLETQGYMLRPRLRPGWSPSWKKVGGPDILDAEDAIASPSRPNLIDATRISDGNLVYIKRVATGDQESAIVEMLCAGERRDDPRNHSVPILDRFTDDGDATISYIVMPFLRDIKEPPFQFVGEVLDFANQILEGLVFLHENGIAHRDCSAPNLMMDASPLYPKGFHPVKDLFLPDVVTVARPYPRISTGVKYFYVDFGISSHIPPNSSDKLVVGREGRDQDVPELSDDIPYDPFKVDIFTVGNVLRRLFHKKFSNVEFLTPLIESMTRQSPADRPTAVEALEHCRSIQQTFSAVHRHWRLISRDEPSLVIAIWNVTGVVRLGVHALKWAFGHRYPY